MDDFSLTCFLEVAKHKSFTKASEQLGRTQSAMTQRIFALEKRLGVKLFQRGKSISLTKEGEILKSYATQICDLMVEIQDRLKSPDLEGKIRFGLPEDFATKFLSEILFSFTRIHPKVLLEVECDLTINLLKRFKQDEFDMVLVKLVDTKDFPSGVEVWSEPLEWVLW